MRPQVAALVLLVAATPFATAQVINGESIYEDNYYHKPPPDTPRAEPPSVDTKKKPGSTAPEAEPPAAEAPPY